jgi:thiol-disulfide isomerase/thioredoxin
MARHTALVSLLCIAAASTLAQTGGREALERGRTLWDQRLSKSAIAALETATADRATAAEAYELLGRIYTFKGWQQEAAFPGWHDEPQLREKAIAALRQSLQIDPGRESAREALRTAEGFAGADSVPPAPPRPAIAALAARVETLRAANAPLPELIAAIDAWTAAQADPAPYFAGANILLARGEYDRATAMAEKGAAASDRFVDDNLSAYQMAGKSQGFSTRGHATAAAIAGWALFKKGNIPGAIARLEEAERLYQGLDAGNQFQLGQVEQARGAADRARDHYLNALSLGGVTPALREQLMRALAEVKPAAMAGGFDAWLDGELSRRRDDRRALALRSIVDRPLPALPLKTLDGRPFDAAALRGKVVLLDFFASWCGICKAEVPHLKAAYGKYQDNAAVAFVLVSIDEDAARLQRFLADMKFPFPVARLPIDFAEQTMGFDNVPATFYVDRGGVVRYQTNGTEAHGDSPTRVSWYIDRLLAQP